MNLLSVENISKSYGVETLFEQISFGIQKGQRVALVARNGTGKTTLLKCLVGKETPDEGTITFRKGIKVGLLDQEAVPDPKKTVRDVLMDPSDPVMKAVAFYEKVTHSEDQERLQEAIELMEHHKAWNIGDRVEHVLSKLKLQLLDRKVETLSGGQKKRLMLARVLIDPPDLMILDEPTNHLDMEMIEWLEGYLRADGINLLLVTHDRYFLDRVCNEILELENEQLYRYKGNYRYFVEKKAEREAEEQAHLDKARNLLRKEKEWMNKQPKARGTKAKSRQNAYYELEEKARAPEEERALELDVKVERLGAKVLEAHNLKKYYGAFPILDGFDHVFKRGERVGLIGPNGVGKSSFLNLLAGLEEPDGGKVVHGETLRIGYYQQEGIAFAEDQRVIETIREIADRIPLEKGREIPAAQMLERFGFPRKRQWDQVEKLSGGEKRRLYLLTVLMKNPNFLILDEPTNDLDIYTLNVLEDYLKHFPGCLILVSHDRFFMDKVVDHLFVLKGEGLIKDFPGNYSHFLEKEGKKGKGAGGDPRKTSGKRRNGKPKKKKAEGLSYKYKLEKQELEKEINELEKKESELGEKLNRGDLKADELTEASEELGRVMRKLEEKTQRWMELEEGE
ncbi:MAG: ABC-F family ATP-binding cassette domain-containing protein [Flavobacteriales bacterium]